jgi:hypothetical protein
MNKAKKVAWHKHLVRAKKQKEKQRQAQKSGTTTTTTSSTLRRETPHFLNCV